jgi:hypothetical protein
MIYKPLYWKPNIWATRTPQITGGEFQTGYQFLCHWWHPSCNTIHGKYLLTMMITIHIYFNCTAKTRFKKSWENIHMVLHVMVVTKWRSTLDVKVHSQSLLYMLQWFNIQELHGVLCTWREQLLLIHSKTVVKISSSRIFIERLGVFCCFVILLHLLYIIHFEKVQHQNNPNKTCLDRYC